MCYFCDITPVLFFGVNISLWLISTVEIQDELVRIVTESSIYLLYRDEHCFVKIKKN